MQTEPRKVDLDQVVDLSNLTEVTGEAIEEEIQKALQSQKIKPQPGLSNAVSREANSSQSAKISSNLGQRLSGANSGQSNTEQNSFSDQSAAPSDSITIPNPTTVNKSSNQPNVAKQTAVEPDQTNEDFVDQEPAELNNNFSSTPVQSNQVNSSSADLSPKNDAELNQNLFEPKLDNQENDLTAQNLNPEDDEELVSASANAKTQPNLNNSQSPARTQDNQEKNQTTSPSQRVSENKTEQKAGDNQPSQLTPQEQQQKKQELEKEKLAKKAQRLKMAGAAQKAAGRGMQASGKTMKATGKGLNQAGQAMVKSGEALSETGLGAIVGVPLMAAGAAAQAAGSGMNVAGEGLDKAGQSQVQSGNDLQNLGKKIEKSLGRSSGGDPKDQDVKGEGGGQGPLGSGGEEMMKIFSRIQEFMLSISTGGASQFLQLNARLLGTIVPFLEKLSKYFKPFDLKKIKDIGDMLLCFIIDGVFLVVVFILLAYFSLITFCAANIGECLAKGFGMPEWMASVVQGVADIATWMAGGVTGL